MAASKTLSPAQRRERARNAVAVAVERRRLIKEIADRLHGEPLSEKTVEELRALVGAK